MLAPVYYHLAIMPYYHCFLYLFLYNHNFIKYSSNINFFVGLCKTRTNCRKGSAIDSIGGYENGGKIILISSYFILFEIILI